MAIKTKLGIIEAEKNAKKKGPKAKTMGSSKMATPLNRKESVENGRREELMLDPSLEPVEYNGKNIYSFNDVLEHVDLKMVGPDVMRRDKMDEVDP
jgi:hypothetical protein